MEILERIEVYLNKTHISPSRFGRLALGDPRLVEDLRSGRRLRKRTLERLTNFLSDGRDLPHGANSRES